MILSPLVNKCLFEEIGDALMSIKTHGYPLGLCPVYSNVLHYLEEVAETFLHESLVSEILLVLEYHEQKLLGGSIHHIEQGLIQRVYLNGVKDADEHGSG